MANKVAFPIQKEALHHAYCISGGGEKVCVDLVEFIEEELNIPKAGNPDFYHEIFETLGIDDARRINEMQRRKSFSSLPKIFVLEASGLTVEAQNALLKMFEEPAPATHFFLVMKNADRLLPTLKSRLYIVEREAEGGKESEAQDFMEMNIPERLTYSKKLADDISAKKKTKQEVMNLCNGLEICIERMLRKAPEKETAQAAELIVKVRGYLYDRAPSVKTLLDTLSINLPILSKKRV